MNHAACLFLVLAVCGFNSPAAAIAQHIPSSFSEYTPEERQLIDAILQGDLAKTKLIVTTAEGDLDELAAIAEVYVFDSPSADVVEYLRKKCDLLISDLQIAAIGGDVIVIGHLLKNLDKASRDEALVQGVLPFGAIRSGTPLMLAARNGHSDAVRKLIELGADVDEIKLYEHTPLAAAAKHGHTDIVKLLLNFGAKVNAIADANGFGDAPYTALMRACIGGQAKTARVLLDAGADPNLKREDGQRALHFAAAQGDLECVKLLLEYGADVDAKDLFGRTPLLMARWFSRNEHIAALLKREMKVK